MTKVTFYGIYPDEVNMFWALVWEDGRLKVGGNEEIPQDEISTYADGLVKGLELAGLEIEEKILGEGDSWWVNMLYGAIEESLWTGPETDWSDAVIRVIREQGVGILEQSLSDTESVDLVALGYITALPKDYESDEDEDEEDDE